MPSKTFLCGLLFFLALIACPGTAQEFARPSVTAPTHIGGTVVVAVAVSDGIVLAADSRLTLIYPPTIVPQYKIISDSAYKLFSVGRVGIATWGEAVILGRTVASLVTEFDKTDQGDKTDVEQVAARYYKYFSARYQELPKDNPKPSLGFVFAGYDRKGVGRLIELQFPAPGEPTTTSYGTTSPGVLWRGQTDVILRLIKGFDPSMRDLLDSNLLQCLDKDTKEKVVAKIGGMEYTIPFKGFMLQDAIDLALSLVQTTVDMQRFSFGVNASSNGSIPGVGGAVDVLAINPYELTWVKRKQLTAPVR